MNRRAVLLAVLLIALLIALCIVLRLLRSVDVEQI